MIFLLKYYWHRIVCFESSSSLVFKNISVNMQSHCHLVLPLKPVLGHLVFRSAKCNPSLSVAQC